MSQNLVASLLLKLEDQLSGGLRKVQENLDQLRAVADKVKLSGLKNAQETLDALNQKIGATASQLYTVQQRAREIGPAFVSMERMAQGALAGIGRATEGIRTKMGHFGQQLGVFGAAASGYSVARPIEEYAERDKELRSIGIMEHLSGSALTAEIKRLNALVNHDAIQNGQSSASVAEAYKDLLGQGLPRAAIDGIIGAHTKAATAYGIDPGQLGSVTGSLVGNLKIGSNEKDAGGALAAIAAATQQGRFKIEDFAHALPGLTGTAASLGMTGRTSLNTLAAAAEISTKTAVDATQGGVNLQDLLSYITSNREDNLARKKLGLDMPALLQKAQAHGIDPFDAYLNEIKKLTQGKKPLQQAEAISRIVTNQQARMALLALVQHNDEFEKLRKTLAGINDEKLKMDQASAMQSPSVVLSQTEEAVKQLSLTVGQAFVPLLLVVNRGLMWINDQLTYLNANFPRTTAYVLGGVGVFLGLATVLGAIGFVLPAITAGFSVIAALFSLAAAPLAMFATGLRFVVFLVASLAGISVGAVVAIAAIAAVLAAAAIDIYENWGRFAPFFRAMWAGVQQEFMGFIQFVRGVFTGNFSAALAGLRTAGAGIATLWTGIWNTVKQVFNDFANWVDQWTGGLVHRITSGISGAFAGFNPAALATGAVHGFDNSWVGRHLGLGDAGGSKLAAAGAPGANGTVNVHVTADPGVKATATSNSANVRVATPDRGATVSRP